MAVKLGEVLKKQLSAVVEMAPNPNVSMVKEAVANGFYRRTNLLGVQSSLLRFFPSIAEHPTKLVTTGVYNPQVFQTLLERVSEQGYYEMVKRAVWNDDLSIIDPTARGTEIKKTGGELIPPKQEPPPPPPSTMAVRSQTTERAKIKDEASKKLSDTRAPSRKTQEEGGADNQEPQQDQVRSEEPLRQGTPPAQQAAQEPPEEPAPSPQPASNQPTQQPNLRERFRRRRPRRVLPKTAEQQAAQAPKNPRGWNDLMRRGQNLANRLGYNRLANVLGRLANPGRLLGTLGRSGLRLGINGLTNGGQVLGRITTQAVASAGRGIASGIVGIAAAIGTTGLIIIGVILLLAALLIFLLWYDNMVGNSECDKPNGTMSVEKRLGGRSLDGESVNNGDPIDFVIIVKYDLACRSRTLNNVEVTDVIPLGMEYAKDSARSGFYVTDQPGSGGTYDESTRTLKWTFKDFPMGNPVYIYFRVEPTKNTDGSWSVQDSWVTNEASVRFTGSGANMGSGFAGGNTQGPNMPVDYKTQDALVAATVKGQERNVQILGNRESFIQTVVANGKSEGMERKQVELGKIYDASEKHNVNPLIVLATWGTETGFATSGTAFSCSDTGDATLVTDFDRQVNCAARTYAKYMNIFNENNVDGKLGIDVCANISCSVKTGEVCIYDNQLLYSMDMYGPVCHFHHGNENYRPNFVKFYNKFGGFQ